MFKDENQMKMYVIAVLLEQSICNDKSGYFKRHETLIDVLVHCLNWGSKGDFSGSRKVAYLHAALNKKSDISALLNTKGLEIKKEQREVLYKGVWPFDQPTWEKEMLKILITQGKLAYWRAFFWMWEC